MGAPTRSTPCRVSIAASLIAMTLAAAGCWRGADAFCVGEAAQSRVFELARAQFPNKATDALISQRGVVILDRVLKDLGLDREKPDDLKKAVDAATIELKRAYQTGRYTLDNVAVVPGQAGADVVYCSGRMTFFTSWGIAVRDVTYDLKVHDGDVVEAKLFGL
ncbi:MAG: hypothetical protein KDJ25_01025 [Rhodoblastus sp.]|nr:hypothetical protein [Rhodoblastus sp.]